MRMRVKSVKSVMSQASSLVVTTMVCPWLCPLLLSLFLMIIITECVKVTRKLYASRERRHLNEFAGPKAYPVIGTVKDMIFTDFYDWSEKLCKRWGDPIRLWKFGQPMVFISSYKYAIQLLSKSTFNGKLHDLNMIYRQPGGNGLSTTPANIHPEKRKLLMPAFSRQTVEGSIPMFCEESTKLVQRLDEFAISGQVFNVVDYTMTCLFRMVARSDFGDTFMTDDDKDVDAICHMNALHTIAKNISARILGPRICEKNDFIYFNFTKEGLETKKARDVINSFAKRAIKRRRQHFHQVSHKNLVDPATLYGITDNDTKSGHNSHHKCYLDILLNLVDQGHMTEDDVVGELNNFLGGAYDTTALTVSWTLLLLALHPNHQQRCFEEISQIFSNLPSTKSFSAHLTATETKHMKYLELCLKESLRLFPTAPIFPRSTVEDMVLEDGRIIPAGVDVLIFANLIHRDPQYFPNPDKFLPERHMDGSLPAYMPFSLGVRNCIGQTYGMYQAKIVLAYMLIAYKWEVSNKVEKVEDVKIAYQGLLYPAEGIHLRIIRRQ